MVEPAHAKFSPSGASKWLACAGSLAMEKDMPDTSSKYADEGTAAHTLGSVVLETGNPIEQYLGERIHVFDADETTVRSTWEANAEMVENVGYYVDFVRSEVAKGLNLLVEQKVNFAPWLGLDEDEAWGTADAVLFGADYLHVVDLKYGRGVAVDSEWNEQLILYALGALNTFGELGDFRTIRLTIHQPRTGLPVSWPPMDEPPLAVGELARWAKDNYEAAQAVKQVLELDGFNGDPRQSGPSFAEKMRDPDFAKKYGHMLNPGTKQCRWCKAKATCPALADKVLKTIVEDAVSFDDLTDVAAESTDVKADVSRSTTEMDIDRLASIMAAAELVEMFISAVRAETERRLFAGANVPGFKLVEGKKGARAWSDEAEAEKLLKESFRLKADEMYDKKLISAPAAAKLLKDQPKRLAKVQELITQKAGKPSVAPVSDKRPAYVPVNANDFEDATQEALA